MTYGACCLNGASPVLRKSAMKLWIPTALRGAPALDERLTPEPPTPRTVRAILPYLAMSYLYKRSNRFWHLLIRSQQTARVWRPLVESTRRRHVRFRRRLERTPLAAGSAAHVVSAGV